jgi:hypothetical protein
MSYPLTETSQATNQYGDANQHDGVDYVDDAQIYEYEHGGEQDDGRGDGYRHNGYEPQDEKDYYYEHDNGNDRHHDGRHDGRHNQRDDMW